MKSKKRSPKIKPQIPDEWRCDRLCVRGYTLIFAIVVMLVVTSIAMSFLMYFRSKYYLLDRAKSYTIGRDYCYKGLASLAASHIAYNEQYVLNFSDGFIVKVKKERWGVYNIFYSAVTVQDKKAKFSKVALMGYQKNAEDISLYLRNTNLILTVGDNTSIAGNCYLPAGTVKNNSQKGHWQLTPSQIFRSADTLVQPPYKDSLLYWLSNINADRHETRFLNDSIDASFADDAKIINGDTIRLSGYLHGHVLLVGNHIIVAPGADLEDIVIVTRTISFPDNFKGQLQVFASAIITVGKSAHFEYPSVLALIPETDSSDRKIETGRFILVGDSCQFQGEVYAYAKGANIARQTSVQLGRNTKVTGAIYASGTVLFEGKCEGTVICEKMQGISLQNQNNVLKNVQIELLPRVYTCSGFYPFHNEQQKTAKWLK